MKSISILIPVYRSEKYIKDCFFSVVNQNYKGPLECLFVDDCGGDSSMEILEGLISSYSGPISFRVVHNPKNLGVAASRNVCINNACSEYIYFLDSDDVIPPDCITTLAKPLEDQDYDFVIGAHTVIGEDRHIPSLLFTSDCGLSSPSIEQTYAQELWPVFPVNKLCNRQFLVNNNLFFENGIIHEDNLWTFKLACLAKTMFVVTKVTYEYILRDHSITSSDNDNIRDKSYLVIYARMNEFLRDNERYNINTLSYLNSFMIAVLGRKSSFREFSEMYKKMRSYHCIPFATHLKTSAKRPKQLLKDIHFFFPPFLGAIIEYLIVKALK